MNDVVVDSSVAAKWVIPEGDSAAALNLLATGVARQRRLLVIDLVFPEVVNAIWNRYRRGLISELLAEAWVRDLPKWPVTSEPAILLLETALQIGIKYDRAIYDALFVALVAKTGFAGVAADVPLYNAVKADFPSIVLLRDWK